VKPAQWRLEITFGLDVTLLVSACALQDGYGFRSPAVCQELDRHAHPEICALMFCLPKF